MEIKSMQKQIPQSFNLSHETALALNNHASVVALESALITHGLPKDINFSLAREIQNLVRSKGVCPATMALLNGKIWAGLDDTQLEFLASEHKPLKVSTRNIGIGIASAMTGGTTVAATLLIARMLGIRVFSTGGIGGIHRGNHTDISSDLDELARSPVIVVCSGAKAILDLPATFEALETRGVPVLGFQTDEIPAFYSRKSGLPVDFCVNSPTQIVEIAQNHWEAGLKSAILVCQPPPEDFCLDAFEIENLLQKALGEAERLQIKGAKTTPFLLDRVNEFSGGKSLETNLSLLKNNASLAADIALALSKQFQSNSRVVSI
jgi:pseudouridine-5'-phosphate glycosidase